MFPLSKKKKKEIVQWANERYNTTYDTSRSKYSILNQF